MAANALSVRLARLLLLFALLGTAWLMWSGMFKPLLIVLGLFSCLVTCYVAHRMSYFDNDVFALHFSVGLFVYLLWLTKEIIRSSIEVSRVVLDPALPISPRTVDLDASKLGAVEQVIFGNSITLTPGTLALDLHRGVIKVHSLTREGAESLVSGEMGRRIALLQGD
jgi:multicomponent Na+:H+ antiporter subunit E